MTDEKLYALTKKAVEKNEMAGINQEGLWHEIKRTNSVMKNDLVI